MVDRAVSLLNAQAMNLDVTEVHRPSLPLFSLKRRLMTLL